MIEIGYTLSSEEHDARSLISYAAKAEEIGFSYLSISDHYFPWTDKQGQSNFVWTTLGAISQVTKTIEILTGVTAPIIRYHPAILAQATATCGTLFGERFAFGVGTGENLNEHIMATGWPETEIRQEMLKEAVELIRLLWEGNLVSYYGDYYAVENAKIFTRPKIPPKIIVSALGPNSAELAGEIGDGFISTRPEKELLERFDASGGKGKPKYAQISVCFAPTEEQAKQTACTYWPIIVVPGETHQELRLPKYFEEVSTHATPDEVAKKILCSRDPKKHSEKIQQFIDLGYDHVHIHNVGPYQDQFFAFYQKEVLPNFG